MTPEVKVKKKIRTACAEMGIKLNAAVATGYGKAGQLDFYGLYRGFYLGIEAKATARSKPTELQKNELAEIVANGGYALVIHADNIGDITEVVVSIDDHWAKYDAYIGG